MFHRMLLVLDTMQMEHPPGPLRKGETSIGVNTII